MSRLAYLQRIQHNRSLTANAATLRTLQLAHLQHVPFENLDIHLKRPITLHLPSLFEKIVTRRRGGFCYELNGLFAWLLEALGFHVTHLSASDAHDDGAFGPEFDHLVLLVNCPADGDDIPWLVDVGWGDTFCEPLRIDLTGEQPQGSRSYRLDQHEGNYLLWQRDYDGYLERHYRFTLQPRRYAEFEPMCQFHQTSPQSIFTQRRICTIATASGRITVDGARLIVTESGQRQVHSVATEAEYHALLRNHFGIVLDQADGPG